MANQVRETVLLEERQRKSRNRPGFELWPPDKGSDRLTTALGHPTKIFEKIFSEIKRPKFLSKTQNYTI